MIEEELLKKVREVPDGYTELALSLYQEAKEDMRSLYNLLLAIYGLLLAFTAFAFPKEAPVADRIGFALNMLAWALLITSLLWKSISRRQALLKELSRLMTGDPLKKSVLERLTEPLPMAIVLSAMFFNLLIILFWVL